MKIARTAPKLAGCIAAAVVSIGPLPRTIEAQGPSFCAYQGRPKSVDRSETGFGVAFGKFDLSLNSPSTCPAASEAIQFSGNLDQVVLPRLEICLNFLAMVVVQPGLVQMLLEDPKAGSAPGVVIVNHENSGVVTCRIKRLPSGPSR